MNLKRNRLRDAVCMSLMLGSAGLAGTAFAQDQNQNAQTQKKEAQLGTVVVTGTRMQSQTVTASSPVSEIDGEEFDLVGSSRAEDLVNSYPQLSPAFDSFTNNGATGYPTVDLRGLGTNRTLTLINGNRLAPGAGIAPDISLIPASVIKRVDLLTGGASAVYGSDAIAGVVNFVLDTEFEGVSISAGASAFRHNNDDKYIQGLMNARGFPYPTGDSGFDGFARNIDVAVGSSFADGKGHAMGWMTWRKSEPLFQGERDYSACALNAGGTACGGSATNATGNFYFYQPSTGAGGAASLNPNGTYRRGYGAPYNFAPINYYQRPDQRHTMGAVLSYAINDNFEPYLEMLYSSKKDSVQIAPSGAFFYNLRNNSCSNPLFTGACTLFGIDPTQPFDVYVAKRNVEGGPRYFETNNNQFRVIGGLRGAIGQSPWNYNVSYLYGAVDNSTRGINDFINDRLEQALRGCPAGSFAGCLPYNVFTGGVTPAAARALSGTSMNTTSTTMQVLNGYVSGDLGWGLPSAGGDPIALVAGYEWRREKYDFAADAISEAGGFAGSGGPSLPLAGEIRVRELFLESGLPIYKSDGFMKSFGLDLGYRLSDYSKYVGSRVVGTSPRTETWKVGFNTDMGIVRVRGGYNKAMRAANVAELFNGQSVQLYTGVDPCAGAAPSLSAQQCLNTGLPLNRYGTVAANPAGQNNQLVGGNVNLDPESAKTWTLGFVVLPMRNLRFNVDYYDILIEDRIGTIGANTILNQCATTGNPLFCGLVRRNPQGFDIWRGNTGYVINTNQNFGNVHFRGLDFGGAYSWDMLGGRMYANFNGNYVLEQTIDAAPGIAPAIDCAGLVNPSCQSPKWRHIANLGWNGSLLGVNLRWRRFGEMDYTNTNGTPGTIDRILVSKGNKVAAYDYLDVAATFNIGSATTLVVGVNNLADKSPPMVGSSISPANGNALGGYDQAGRMFFTNVTFKF